MAVSIFSQFEIPSFLGLNLTLPMLMFPLLLMWPPAHRLVTGRLTSLQTWFLSKFVKHIFAFAKPQAHKWALLLISVMVTLMSLNVLGMVPYSFTPTTQLSVNLCLAIPLWLGTVLLGTRKQTKLVFGHMVPLATPPYLVPFLVLIETISMFIRPLALAMRLTANLTAGHLLIQIISMAAFLLFSVALPTAPLLILILLLLVGLEMAVAIIQAYVFVLLLNLYLQDYM